MRVRVQNHLSTWIWRLLFFYYQFFGYLLNSHAFLELHTALEVKVVVNFKIPEYYAI
jgi:hypothetical protein